MTERSELTTSHHAQPASTWFGLQNAGLWLLAFSGCVVTFEPAPYEIVFLLVALLFVATGLRLHWSLGPLIVLLAGFAAGGLLANITLMGNSKALTFVVVSIYLAVTAIVYAAILAEHTGARLMALRSGYIAGATLASLLALLGTFDLGGLGGVLTTYGRASATFKDPNVLGAFLVPPLAFLLQDMLIGRRYMLLRGMAALLITAGIFLSFSRGAWASAALACVCIVLLTFLLSGSPRLQARSLLVAFAGLCAVIGLVMIVLSVDQIHQLFEMRARLDQSYDVGETGRFGRQLRSLSVLLDRPNGLGAHQFGIQFGEDPHNVYLNAFFAYGWLGGFSYLLLIFASISVSMRIMLADWPFRLDAVAVAVPLLTTILQGLQIDTDHWRHMFLLLGCVWGLYAALLASRRRSGFATAAPS